MPSIECQQGCRSGLARAFSDHGIEGSTTAHPLFHQRPHGGHIESSTQCNDLAMFDEVPFKESPRIRRRQPMRRRKSRENCIGFNESRRWDCQLFAAIKAPFEFGCSRGVVLMPRADSRNHAAGIEDKHREPSVRPLPERHLSPCSFHSTCAKASHLPRRFGHEEPSLVFDPDGKRLGLDFKHAVTPANFQRCSRLQCGFPTDVTRYDQTARLVHGYYHGADYTMRSAT